LPIVLTRQHFAIESNRNYAIVVAVTTVATLFVAQHLSRRGDPVMHRLSRLMIVGGLCSGALLAFTLLSGSSWKGIIEGLLTTPLRMPGVAFLPVSMPSVILINAGAALITAIVVMAKRSDSRLVLPVAALKAVFGITGAFIFATRAPMQLAYLLPWVWLVAIPASNENDASGQESFLRTFLALASAWQALQAYPIAGTQVAMATLLLVVGYTVCLRDVWNVVITARQFQRRTAALSGTSRRLIEALALVGVLFLFANVWCDLPAVRREHAKLRPLNLPGSRHVRMDDELVELNQSVTEYLKAESDTFVTYPGINSLYFWTGQYPPTQINSTGWGQLSYAQQEEILASLRKARRPRLLIIEAALRTWNPTPPKQILPLVQFVTQECRAEKRLGRFIVFSIKPADESSASH
jgi:hypothetical protein